MFLTRPQFRRQTRQGVGNSGSFYLREDGKTETSVSGGYIDVIPVDRDKLINLGVSQQACRRFASSQNTVQLNIIEFFHALADFPIAFVRQQDDTYTPCAVLGLNIAENLFADEQGNWLDGSYCPAYIRRYPFVTQSVTVAELSSDDEDLRKPVYVDKAALDDKSPALFVANGKATAEWASAESFVSDYISAEKQTLSFTQKLVDLKLLQPFDAQVHPDDGDMVRLKGLYRINENLLNKLPAKVVKDLMQSGEMSRIYAHLISLENFAKLLDRKTANKNI